MAINVKKAISSAAKTVKSTVNNAGKQLAALGSSLSGKKASAATTSSTFAPMSKPGTNGAPMTTTTSLQASRSTPSSSSTRPASTPTFAPMTKMSTNGAPMSTTASLQSSARTAAPKRSSGGSGNMSAAITALEGMFGGGMGKSDTYASDGGPGVSDAPTYAPQMSTYRGSTGVNQTMYMPGQTQSLEARASQPSPAITPESRMRSQGIIAEWDNGAADREKQLAALQGQLAALQAVQQDPMRISLEQEEDEYAKEEERLQKEMERLTKPSEEYLEAKALEDELTAKEAAIKAGVNRTTAEISSQPIPYGFITGQSAAVERRANADLETIAAQRIPIQQRLANEQARRAAALDVVKSSASRIANRYDRASDRSYNYAAESRQNKREDEKTAYNRQKDERDFNEDVRRFGLTYALDKQRANKAPEMDTQIVVVGKDQVLINARTGEVIKNLGPAPREI